MDAPPRLWEERIPEDLLVEIMQRLPNISPSEQSGLHASAVCRRWRGAARNHLWFVSHSLEAAAPNEDLQQLAAWSGHHPLGHLILSSPLAAVGSHPASLDFSLLGRMQSLDLQARLSVDWATLASCSLLTSLMIRSPPAVPALTSPRGHAEGQVPSPEPEAVYAALRALGEGLRPMRLLLQLDVEGMLDLEPELYPGVDNAGVRAATAWLSGLTQLQRLRTSLGLTAAWALPRLTYLSVHRPLEQLCLSSTLLGSRLTSLVLCRVKLHGAMYGLPPLLPRLLVWACQGSEASLWGLSTLRHLDELGFEGGGFGEAGGVDNGDVLLAHPRSELSRLTGLGWLKVGEVWDPGFLLHHAPGLLRLEALCLALPSHPSQAAVEAWQGMAFLACLDMLPALRYLVILPGEGAFASWELQPAHEALLRRKGCKWLVSRVVPGLWPEWY